MDVCKGCGKNIIWGTTAEGKSVPLDPRAPVMFKPADGSRLLKQKEVKNYIPDEATDPNDYSKGGSGCQDVVGQWCVSHFATCPQANEFSGKNKEAKHG